MSRSLLSPRPLLAALAILACAPRLGAALVEYDLSGLAKRSSRIVCGKVVDMRSYWGMLDDVGPLILTDVTLQVDETWKGRPVKEITLQLVGGRVGDEWQWCPESPGFVLGEEVLVFARKWKGRLWTTGWIQGKYRLERDPAGNRRVRAREKLPVRNGERLGSVKAEVARLLRESAEDEGTVEPETPRSGDAPSPSVPPPSEPEGSSEPAETRATFEPKRTAP